MGVPFTNCLLSTQRATQNLNTGLTGPAKTQLMAQPAYLEPRQAIGFMSYQMLPPIVLESDFEAHLDPDVDIQVGDYVSITLKDGRTPWPGIAAQDTLHVVFTDNTPPPFVEQRLAYIKRVRTGGLPT